MLAYMAIKYYFDDNKPRDDKIRNYTLCFLNKKNDFIKLVVFRFMI